MKTKRVQIWIHAFIWVYMISTLWIFVDISYFQYERAFTYFSFYILSWVFHALLFYFNYIYLIPQFLFKRKYVTYVCLLVIASIINFYVHAGLWNEVNFWKYFFNPKPDHFWHLIYWQIRLIFISTGIKLWELWMISEKNKGRLKKEIKNSELQFLKSQMSPHFLFNTLNNIFGLSIKEDKKTSEALGQLKDMMEYISQLEQGEKILLKSEIQSLKNFISLSALRYNVKISSQFETIHDGFYIEPMLLLPFIENAFKHGDTSQNGKVNISLTESENWLQFSVINDKSIAKQKDEVSGVGIQNVKKRIKLLYPQHQFEIKETHTSFSIYLSIPLS